MKKRYSVFLRSITPSNPAAQSYAININFDIRTLIPSSERGKKFHIYSAFHTGSFNENPNDISAIEVGINLPQGFNKTFPSQQFMPIGVATAITFKALGDEEEEEDAQFMFMYPESACLVKMVDFPNIHPLQIQLRSTDIHNIPNNLNFCLNLTFEECEDY